METWQVEIIQTKLDFVERQMFSLEVDLRVARKTNDKKSEQQVVELMKMAEAQRLALEEELK